MHMLKTEAPRLLVPPRLMIASLHVSRMRGFSDRLPVRCPDCVFNLLLRHSC